MKQFFSQNTQIPQQGFKINTPQSTPNMGPQFQPSQQFQPQHNMQFQPRFKFGIPPSKQIKLPTQQPQQFGIKPQPPQQPTGYKPQLSVTPQFGYRPNFTQDHHLNYNDHNFNRPM
ncbi:unnamed protein product [Parnassius apollo]|uniref:(apollo) hypothetical protein n=1 Tax=Parnassius apollo TaxID=110799 RepID=A0A8S3WD21_PARAO|nr:unnamed protein product [Parnassius apollo]